MAPYWKTALLPPSVDPLTGLKIPGTADGYHKHELTRLVALGLPSPVAKS